MTLQVCPIHTDEDVEGVSTGDAMGTLRFECTRAGHPGGGPLKWPWIPEPKSASGMSGLAVELGLLTELPLLLAEHRDIWVEFGVVERAYALRKPKDFALLVETYGHRAVRPTRYTASAFLAHTMSQLVRQQALVYRFGPATGYWSYNGQISYWSLAPEPEVDRLLTWAAAGHTIDYL